MLSLDSTCQIKTTTINSRDIGIADTYYGYYVCVNIMIKSRLDQNIVEGVQLALRYHGNDAVGHVLYRYFDNNVVSEWVVVK